MSRRRLMCARHTAYINNSTAVGMLHSRNGSRTLVNDGVTSRKPTISDVMTATMSDSVGNINPSSLLRARDRNICPNIAARTIAA
jgi:hypothetical protein